jgi:hypothetical protein
VRIGRNRMDILLRKKMHLVTGGPFFSRCIPERNQALS